MPGNGHSKEARLEGERVARRLLTTASEELGARVSLAVLSLRSPARILRCWGKAERPARHKPPGGEEETRVSRTLTGSAGYRASRNCVLGMASVWWLLMFARTIRECTGRLFGDLVEQMFEGW